jgi:hypothetical protein
VASLFHNEALGKPELWIDFRSLFYFVACDDPVDALPE